MNRIAAFVTENARLAWVVALLFVVASSVLAAHQSRDRREAERLSLLQTEVGRRGIEIMSQTLNGNVMGSLSLLGVIDDEVKRDALGTLAPNSPYMTGLLAALSGAHGADGVFVIGQDGILKSSWDISGRPSTGLDVRFRPYYQMAMQGRDNVYAAVSLARGDRSLYFATPVFAANSRNSAVVGAVVARTSVARVDSLLRERADISLLLSPQGVVFASSRPEWIGTLAGMPSPERLKAIRDLKQFGAMFDRADPPLLPFAVDGGMLTLDGRHFALASAKVQWNDPYGEWSVVLMEDLSRTVSPADSLWAGLGTAAVLLIMGALALTMLRYLHAQTLAIHKNEDLALAQAASAERKSRRAEAGLNFQRAKSTHELARTFLAETHRILGALQGMIYVCVGQGQMRLAASYACDERVPDALESGQGLLGQCVIDRQPRVLDTTDHHSWTIRSALGNARPAAVMMAPLLLDDSVLGVVEIAVLNHPDQHAREQFVELASLLALNLEILRRHSPAGTALTEANP
ncbi:C4-dicarboxylate transporter [Paramagnetospirillum kuznetsovii]|uniref:C4-dicarboxylate transporter n=1 Tax=Paramagnetospirillum kuznetsovii TaxID=2053833 RepID=A0A364P261_9PROT|nr:GAF domain-containing protein [Paramagnetospirillum kuznetsovii]RAU23439.1 C4-dicarboxylate transporter [Paramagnetospirillum kuznetsovii]